MQMIFQNKNQGAINIIEKQPNNPDLFFSKKKNERLIKYDMFQISTMSSTKCASCGHK